MSSTGNRNGRENFRMNSMNDGIRTLFCSAMAFDHEIRAVADVGGRAEENRSDADGQNLVSVSH
jgi:hypothetical protein